MKWKILHMPDSYVRDEAVSTATYGRFIVKPLERGFGYTLGNTLRRVLLSSLQGAAVVACKLNNAGVLHEFTAIPGVLEDMTDIVLNLKQIRFKHLGDGPRVGLFRSSKAGAVKAGDLQISSDIMILNPEQHIATLNKDADFELEVEVATGRGYVTAEDLQKLGERPLGTVVLDANFSPVTHVSYGVESARIGQRIDYDELIIEVWTDGSILPQDSLGMAGKILRDHFNLFVRFEEQFEEEAEEKVDEEFTRIKALLEKSVDELELSVRSANCLRAARIRSLGDLVQKSEQDMLQYRNFGKKSLKEIQDLIQGMGLDFGMDVTKYLGVRTAPGELEFTEEIEEGDGFDEEALEAAEDQDL
ncbi:MAG: DNA-directed RNA polymerase subunit alpha [Candidatus Eisenbacteria bacterium]|uniref:DNA-directed RNA polymerase subunit alpha n=1 Tax=Eiseniibacteriota bacterium TaxID=2212470 RepID=A0A938BRV7_UNCEI|nr:DNA-directed RNA polymerase subunit alpha [Candidatus Eisenbacteria bacterium]